MNKLTRHKPMPLVNRPDDIPEDVWEAAEAAMAHVGWFARSMIKGAAWAIMAEREACASLAEFRDEEGLLWPDGPDIASAIRAQSQPDKETEQ